MNKSFDDFIIMQDKIEEEKAKNKTELMKADLK
jgi:hypothetical protein